MTAGLAARRRKSAAARSRTRRTVLTPAQVAARMSEKKLLEHVRRIVRDLGLLCYHTHRSERSEPGYPDLHVCGPGGSIFVELKTAKGKVTAAQQQWLEMLARGGSIAVVRRPEHLVSGQIARELATLRRPRRRVAA